jgi:serine/threonine protein kinase
VKVLDLGLMNLYTTDEEWRVLEWVYTPYMEYLMSPEIAIELFKSHYAMNSVEGDQMNVFYPHDHRMTDQWKFACIIFELLHGFAPWEDAKWDDDIESIRDWYSSSAPSSVWEKRINKMLLRRTRMINEELPISEELSQDCVDWLRAMLHRDHDQRPEPTLKEAASFAWLQGQWVNQGPFKRPSFADDGSVNFPPGETDRMDLTGA